MSVTAAVSDTVAPAATLRGIVRETAAAGHGSVNSFRVNDCEPVATLLPPAEAVTVTVASRPPPPTETVSVTPPPG